MTTPSAPEPSPAPENAATGQQEAKAGLSFRRFCNLLVSNGLVDPAALDDPEGYDNYKAIGRLTEAHREIFAAQPVTCIGRCRDCRWWQPDKLKCTSDKFFYVGGIIRSKITDDSLTYADFEGYSAHFTTGPDFGCVHWEARG